jgi:hypothetical protein
MVLLVDVVGADYRADSPVKRTVLVGSMVWLIVGQLHLWLPLLLLYRYNAPSA